MLCPPFGICVPVEPLRVRDADTIEVRLRGGSLVWAVRLLGVWAPELHRGAEQGLAAHAKAWVERFVAANHDLRLYIELPHERNLLHALSFDRVVGTIFVGPGRETLNELVVRHGLASSTKNGRLGE